MSRATLETALIAACVVIVILLLFATALSIHIANLADSEREAWEQYHQLRSTQGAMELF